MRTPQPFYKRPLAPGMGLGVYVGLYLFFLYLPVCLIPLFSFNDSIQAAFPLKGFTVGWYRALLHNDGVRRALLTSLEVGGTSAFLATLCGLTLAYARVFLRSGLSTILSGLCQLPLLIPGVIVGIAMLIVVNVIGVGPSRIALVCGHMLVGLPTAFMILYGRLAGLSRSIPEAAEDLGAREWTTFSRIILPLALPALGSAFMLAFLTSFDEFIIAFFLTGSEPTLPVYIWGQLRFPRSLPLVMALGSLILAVSIIIAAASELMRRRGKLTERQAVS